jgi:hypothetical protein
VDEYENPTFTGDSTNTIFAPAKKPHTHNNIPESKPHEEEE